MWSPCTGSKLVPRTGVLDALSCFSNARSRIHHCCSEVLKNSSLGCCCLAQSCIHPRAQQNRKPLPNVWIAISSFLPKFGGPETPNWRSDVPPLATTGSSTHSTTPLKVSCTTFSQNLCTTLLTYPSRAVSLVKHALSQFVSLKSTPDPFTLVRKVCVPSPSLENSTFSP